MNDSIVKIPASALGQRLISALVLAPVTAGLVVVGGWPFIALMIFAFLIAAKEWRGIAFALPRPWLFLVGGCVYLVLCFMAFVLLRLMMPLGAFWALAMVVTLWASDTGAYFTGRRFGGPKLAPSISPKKTWSGFAGALGAAGVTLFLYYYLFFSHDALLRVGTVDGRPLQFFITGMAAGGIGQAGDLLESCFKRKAGVKDSGTLIPGHGGLLDRIDSLLLVSPVFLALSWFWLR